MKRTAIAAAAVAGFAGFASAQPIIEIVVDQNEVDVSGGAVVVNFSMYYDTLGFETGIDVGANELQDFFGWSGINGVFRSTAGTFIAQQETDDDAAGGVVDSPFGPGTIADSGWFGRRPGIAAVNGSDGEVPPFGTVNDFATGADGSDGSFRFTNTSGVFEVRDGGLTLGGDTSLGGNPNILGLQAPTVVGGENQDTSSRIEVFRGQISFDESDLGMQDIDYDGFASFFLEPGLDVSTSFRFENVGGGVNVVPTPASVALLGLGGLAAGRRRR